MVEGGHHLRKAPNPHPQQNYRIQYFFQIKCAKTAFKFKHFSRFVGTMLVSKVLLHSPESNFMASAQAILYELGPPEDILNMLKSL